MQTEHDNKSTMKTNIKLLSLSLFLQNHNTSHLLFHIVLCFSRSFLFSISIFHFQRVIFFLFVSLSLCFGVRECYMSFLVYFFLSLSLFLSFSLMSSEKDECVTRHCVRQEKASSSEPSRICLLWRNCWNYKHECISSPIVRSIARIGPSRCHKRQW